MPISHGASEDDTAPAVVLYQWLLAGWGIPIREIFDLEHHEEHCRQMGRWNFLSGSVPMEVGWRANFCAIVMIGGHSGPPLP